MARKLRLNGQQITLPQGVEVRGNRIRIGFTYRGRYCYETLPGEPTAASIKRAGVKRAAIMLEIEEGRFEIGAVHIVAVGGCRRVKGCVGGKSDVGVIREINDVSAVVATEKGPVAIRIA